MCCLNATYPRTTAHFFSGIGMIQASPKESKSHRSNFMNFKCLCFFSAHYSRKCTEMGRIGFLLAMTAIGASFASTQIEWYPVSPAHRTDGRVTGAINNTPVTFEYFRNIDQYYFDVNYIRFAADGPVDVRLDVNAPVKRARLRTVLKAIPFERDDSTFVFTLPGPGHYYLQLPDLGKPESQNEKSGTYTVLFFVDDLNEMNEKKMKPDDPHTTVVTKQGVISHQNLDQTDKIQSILDGG